MTLKSLVTGIVTGTAAAALVGAAAAGAATIAASGTPASPAVQPTAFGVPMPQAPAPDLQGPLMQTLNALAAGGSFAGAKSSYIQGGVGRIEALTADRAFENAAAEGAFPISFSIANIDQIGGSATANVTATTANGKKASEVVTFFAGPSPSGWQLSRQSAMALLSTVG